MKYLPILTLLMLISILDAMRFEDCGSEKGEVQSVEVSGCEDLKNDEGCELKSEEKTLKIVFKSKEESESVKAAFSFFYWQEMDIPMSNTDGCKSGISCPMEDGKQYTYKESFKRELSNSPLIFPANFTLLDNDNNTIICIQLRLTGKNVL